MAEIDTRTMLNSAAAAASVAQRVIAREATQRKLSPVAQAVAAARVPDAYSPIVLAGFVRLSEFVMIGLIGAMVYTAYVVPLEGFYSHYVPAILGISALAVLAFQAADIYHVQAFRNHVDQFARLASAWSVVFLIAIGASFFAKLGDSFSRIWLAGFYGVGFFALIGFRLVLFAVVRHWTHEGRLDRRTVVVGADESGEMLIKALDAQRDSDVHIVGVFDDRGDER